jgi:hypothetical protein
VQRRRHLADGLVARGMSALTHHEPSMDRDESCGGGSLNLEVVGLSLGLPNHMVLVFPTSLNILGDLVCAPRSCYARPWFWLCVLTVAVYVT